MSSELSVRRTFLRLLGSVRNLRHYLMIRRGPNMSLLTVTFTYQYSLRSVWWDMIPSIGMIMAVIQKWLLRPWTFILRTRTNQNASFLKKLYRRIVPWTTTNQNKASSTKTYRRTILRTCTNNVKRRYINHNTLLQNKETKGMRLHIICLILRSLTYLNAEETILTCHMKERTWQIKAMNTLRTFLTLWTNIKIFTSKDCPVKISKKLFSASWNNKKKKSSITSIILHAILHFSLPLLWMYKIKMKIGN